MNIFCSFALKIFPLVNETLCTLLFTLIVCLNISPKMIMFCFEFDIKSLTEIGPCLICLRR